MKTGRMKSLFTWLQCSHSKEGTYGQSKETFSTHGTLYGWVEELSAGELLAFGIRQGMATSKIHLRMEDANGLAAVDRLQDARTGDVWWVDGVSLDMQSREILAYVHVYRATGVV